MKKILAIAGLAAVMVSCNSDYEKTSTGLTYKIFKGDKKEKLKHGQIIKINGEVKIDGRDTVLFSTYGHLPEYMPVDTTTRKSHDFNEVLKLCAVGDSLVVIAQVDTLVKMGLAQYNEVLKQRDQIKTTIKILGVFEDEAAKVKDQTQEVEKEKAREIAALENELKKKGIKAQKTANGVFVETIQPGTGPLVTAGNEVTVNYKGSLVSTGKVFDSNTDTTHGHVEPFKFVIGSGGVIPGWDEAAVTLSKGAKANIYIPALMAYGPAGRGPVIPPYAPLKFEMEILNIGTPAPQPIQQGMQGMPQFQPGQGQPQGQQQGQGNPPQGN
ncbi:MAG: hypothetical protein JWQ96_1061 [Segetibacter sp.]|nr:hypothetical protein [Segetibacter sp.]